MSGWPRAVILATPMSAPDPKEIALFRDQGFLIVPRFVRGARLVALQQAATRLAQHPKPPLEYEAEVRYPGSPANLAAPGGRTVRRLLQACSREPVFCAWGRSATLTTWVAALLGSVQPQLVQAHHNCLMTKEPRFSSDTGWHQDIRYWNYEQPDLVNAWLALTAEHPENGCLRLLAGTHHTELPGDALDEHLFLRPEHPVFQALIARQHYARLEPGDVLFFHARSFHAADRNRSDRVKLSLVFTYKDGENRARPGTRSANLPDLPLPAVPGTGPEKPEDKDA